MIVLGIHFGHGAAAALVVGGQVIAAIEEEKLNRIKGYVGFPFMAVDYVLNKRGLTAKDIDRVAIAAEDLAEFSYCFIHLAHQVFQRGRSRRLVAHFLDQYKYLNHAWDSSALLEGWFCDLFESATGIPRDKIERVNHHLAHAASAFYCSPWQEALVLTADGKGDGLCGGAFIGSGNEIHTVDTVPDRYSVGQLYQAVTKFLGYRANRHEGKITGLAAFGNGDEAHALMRRVLGYDNGKMFNRLCESEGLQDDPIRFYERSGISRDYIKARYVRYLNGDLRKYAIVHQLYQNLLKEQMGAFAPEDLAAGVQQLAEELIAGYAARFLPRCPGGKLCLAGGVFANVKINQRIRELVGVDQLFVQPAMDDAGCALGAALYLTATNEGLGQRPAMGSVYQGPGYAEDYIESRLQAAGLCYDRPAEPEKEVARNLHEGKIVGRYAGQLEWGPRALGNRSILARPTKRDINQELNARLKRTEFMPFAPSILAERAGDYLVDYHPEDLAARYMTTTYDIYPGRRQEEIAAAVHIDGTARPQVVFADDNPDFHKIISEYHRISGIPAVVNTSFNMHEEPMVASPDDAIRALRAGAVDLLSMGPFIVGGLQD
jgi:carbamoyltransferase